MTWIPNDIHQDQDLYIRELQTYLRTVATRHIEIPLISRIVAMSFCEPRS